MSHSCSRGGGIFDPVVALPPEAETGINPKSFTARWNKVDKANSYLLSVYTRSENDTTVAYVNSFERKDVGDTDKFEVTGLTPATTYHYVVQATDGLNTSAKSNEITVVTLEPSGVGGITANDETVTVTSIDKRLIVTATSATTFEIHELSGRKVASEEMDAGKWTSPELQTGVYIVTAGKRHVKVIID